MRNGVHTGEDFLDVKATALELCHEMHCGDLRRVQEQRLTLYRRYGQEGWLLHGALLAELTDEHAPEQARDVTGAVLPHRVVAPRDDPTLRSPLLGVAHPPVQERQERAITHVTNLLACAHLREGLYALAELERALLHHLETLTATVTLMLRVASLCVPCPRTEHHT